MMRWFEHYLQGPGGQPPAPSIEYREKAQAAPPTSAQEQP
jgi:hypothetical protein